MSRVIRNSLGGDTQYTRAARQEMRRHAARVHLDLLDQFIALTKRARNDAPSGFLYDSLDEQIEWLYDLKSGYSL